MMEGGEGMVAVVRGLRDSSLAVTLLDGSRQYTLMPNAGNTYPQPQAPASQVNTPQGYLPAHMHVPVSHAEGPRLNVLSSPTACPHHQPARSSSEMSGDQPVRCDSGSQATDGRYASMYKMAHCSVTPTSPPVQLTEFPPQRSELCRGHGNFEVGGTGSGENYVSCRSNGSFRGGMSWPDRGSVCSPRPSREPDAFANSLRKYPNINVERSSEMVERLITYTQAKNLAKSYQNRYPSPSKHGIESNASNQLVLDRSTSRNSVPRPNYQKSYEPDVRIKARVEESPTRDMRSECECTEYRRMKTTDSRSLNVAKKGKDIARSCSYSVPYNQPCVGPVIRERYDNFGLSGQRSPSLLTATNSVNMEVQAAAEMVSREVATVPRADTVKRTVAVAVPLSRTSSSDDQKREGDVFHQHSALTPTHKSVETSSMPVDLSIQTTSSNTVISNPLRRCQCYVVERKSKSEESLNVDKELSDEIMELLNKVSVCPYTDSRAYDLRREVMKEMSKKLQKMSENMSASEAIQRSKDKIGNIMKYVPIWVPCGDVQSYRDTISDEIISKMNNHKSFSKVYRADTQIKTRTECNELEAILHSIIASMPIKTMDIFGKPVEKSHIIESYVKRVKRLITNIHDKTDMNILKSEILVMISKIPIAISANNKVAYLSKVVDSIINKLKPVYFDKIGTKGLKTEQKTTEQTNAADIKFKQYVQPTEGELKEYISDELYNFLEQYNLRAENITVVETDLIDILIDSIQDIRLGKDDDVANEIMLLLLQTVDNLPENLAKLFTDRILDNVKHFFISDTTKPNCAPTTSRTFDILQSSSKHKQNNNNLENLSEESIGQTSRGNIHTNPEFYMNQLTQEIEEWLDNLKIKIPHAHETGFRQVVVNDIAGDIVERFKYLELNPSCRGTYTDELEHLKYQIFKWINKLAGEDNLQTIENASDLMNRIQSISIPPFAKQGKASNATRISNKDTYVSNSRPGNYTRQVLMTTNKSNIRLSLNQSNRNENSAPTCCSGTNLKSSSPSMRQLNEDYDEFIKKWVQEIPMPSSTCKEKATADKARVGFYNGIWKAITKLKFDPAAFHNPFYYEDALDDELEELFGLLPKTPELETKKHILKVQLIEKTTNTNNLIKSTAAPASFKQQLVDSISNNLPERNKNNDDDDEAADLKKHFEELQILKLVENFILCSKYKEEDKSKANIYRKRLIKETQKLVDGVKKTHGKEVLHIDSDLYVNSILNALRKVPLPDVETILDEAVEIILGHEVDQWFSDLPLVENNTGSEQLKRQRQKEVLVKKVHEIEKEVSVLDCSGERVLKKQVSLFLEKLPLKSGENDNIDFMAEEFFNRIKNRARQQNSSARKSVAFMDSVGYFEFSQQIPQCSSFSQMPGARPAVRDQSSYMIRGGNIVKDTSGLCGCIPYEPESIKEIPSDQYFTMADSQAPKQESRSKMLMQSEKVEWKSIPIASASNMGSPERQQSPCCRNATSPQRQLMNNDSGSQDSRVQDVSNQYNQGIVLMNNIPQEPQNLCCRNQEGNANGSRVVSPVHRRSGTPMKVTANPDMPISQIPILPKEHLDEIHKNKTPICTVMKDALHASQIPMEAMNPDVIHPRPAMENVDVIQNSQRNGYFRVGEGSVNQSYREPFARKMRVQGPPTSISYGEPQGFSTPQQGGQHGSPLRPGRKRTRNIQKNRRDFARRRLDLEDDTEEDLESGEELCPCERMFRCRRRPICYAYDGFEMNDPQCYPMPFGYPYFY